MDRRNRACLARRAISLRPVHQLPGETESNQCDGNEERSIGLQNLKVREPGAADAKADEHERAKAARTRQQGGNTSDGNRSRFQRIPFPGVPDGVKLMSVVNYGINTREGKERSTGNE